MAKSCAGMIIRLYKDLRDFLSIFNYKEGTQTVTFGEATEVASEGNGSDLDCFTAPRAAPYGVLLFLFCTDFMGQQKGGFEQPVPRALRPAGQKRPGGAFLGGGSAKPFGRTKRLWQKCCCSLFICYIAESRHLCRQIF